METDLQDALKVIVKAIGAFAKIFADAWENIITPIRDFVELLKNIKPIEKIKYKPVREIKPTKTFILNKRFNMYYCRNNC